MSSMTSLPYTSSIHKWSGDVPSKRNWGLKLLALQQKSKIHLAFETFRNACSSDLFWVCIEIGDRPLRGAAQALFREFSRELKGYWHTLINAMDTFGLLDLVPTKQGYRPCCLVKSSTVVES